MDVARTVAIISISLNHAANRSYDNYSDQMGEFLNSPLLSSVFKTLITVFSHYGVPIFLMLSGALLLGKSITDEEGVKRFYKHNLLDLFITCEIWYALMYWCKIIVEDRFALANLPYLIFGMVKTMCFVNQVAFGSMWYMPMILCVYLLIPLFAMVLKKVSLKMFVLPCAVVFLSSMVIPNADALLYMATGWENAAVLALESANVFSMYLLYVFAGYWISRGGLAKLRAGGGIPGMRCVFCAELSCPVLGLRPA